MGKKIQFEIGGVKLEVDDRHCKKIETFRVGDPIKILIKNYGDSFTSYYGIIAGFDPFEARPTMQIAYMNQGYMEDPIKFIAVNQDSKDVEIIACSENDLLGIKRDDCLQALDRNIRQKEVALQEAYAKKEFFIKQFGVIYARKDLAKAPAEESVEI